MLQLKKLLLPIDFSNPSHGTIQYAKALAERYGAELTLLHVIDDSPSVARTLALADVTIAGPNLDDWVGEMRAELEKYERQYLQPLRVHREVRTGDPARVIVHVCHSERADLLAMPTHGYGPLRRFLIGSVTAKVLHDVHIPVLTGVHMEHFAAEEDLAFRRVVCAVDPDSSGNLAALQWARQFACDHTAELAIVHVVPDTEMDGAQYKHALDGLEKMQAQVKARGELRVFEGDISERVCEFAASWNADLLVIGRALAGGLMGRLRTHSYAMIRQSPCPVVSV
jgi:nucleotide-binding universal stress UspA family protein